MMHADSSGALGLHNSYRARHGVPALSWSSSIASKAQAYANKCSFSHSGNGLGENLAQVRKRCDAGRVLSGMHIYVVAVAYCCSNKQRLRQSDRQPSAWTVHCLHCRACMAQLMQAG